MDRVAHELKTPLTPLKAIAQLARSRLAKARDGRRELDLDSLDQSLAQIERQVDRLDSLVSDLLEVSRVGRGRFEIGTTPFDLAELVRRAARRWAVSAEEGARHRFAVQAPPELAVVADEARLDRAVMALIDNAVKFSPRGGLVSVTLHRGDGVAVVEVRDEGIGMSRDELHRFGERPFARGEAAAGYAGIGLGLYLARLTAEAHGGRVELESEGEDRGSTVRLRLPL